ncbi:hypothetical protein [Mesorhizobium sp. M0058]|uniref:sacsin N-terminal ATP-binding-like domain-containing protein n=1 Tax=Mesorhizobium sp. M0058 TaxID=2956865 RepID=UPI00333B1AAF
MTIQPIHTPDSFNEESSPEDSNAWDTWIAACLSETMQGYRAKPEWLKRDANGERSIARDYAKRELLELVQNAADAAAEQGGHGRIRIEIAREGLFVANTGMPFRAGGVRSLMTAHTSDKPERQATLIGAKGLGFRALLNWSSEPFVTSGALEIGFSRSHAAGQVEALSRSDARIAALVARSSKPLVPILAFPVAGPALAAIDDPKLSRLMERARALRADGYDTVVAAPFEDEKARQRALDQLAEFHPDFLLFVEALEQIVVYVDDDSPRRWTKYLDASGRYVLELAEGDTITIQEWTCGRKRGALPDPEYPGSLRAYELAIAVRHDAPNAAGRLHCYFPSEVAVPFPALFHATLELDSSRKTLNTDSELNAGVLSALADFFADFLLALRDDPEAPDPLSLLARQAAFPDALQVFEALVYKAARARPLVPTNGGGYASADETKVEPAAFAGYLPARLFPKLALGRTEADRAVITRLQVGVLKDAEIVQVLRQAPMTLDERATAIVGIAKTLPADLHDRTLLLDTEERPLTRNNTSFPPPTSGRPPALPRWARARFLHPELWQKVSTGLGGAMRDRFDKLSTFGINEFSATGVITSLRRQASEVLRRAKVDPVRVRRELLQALFGLRQTVARDSYYPTGLTEVPCANGAWQDASKTHLSAAYGDTGIILSALYASDSGRLLAAPETLGIIARTDELAAFFRWIGVHSWPMAVSQPVPIAYRPLVIDALPAQFEVSQDNTKRNIERAELSWAWTCTAETDWIAGLDSILDTAPSVAILAWLAQDERFDVIRAKPFLTRFRAKSGRAEYKPYHGPLPDLVRHALATRPWLAVAGGERVAPRDAMISPGPLAALFKTPLRPTPAEESQFGVSRAVWQRGLAHAQVPDRLSDLNEAQIYRLLEGLEQRDPGPEVVRRLYGQVLQIEDFDPARAIDAASRFRTSGKVQIRKNGMIGWTPAEAALYLDRDNFPAAAREHLAMLDLPARRSAIEIEARFGVAPLSKQSFSLMVTRLVEDEGMDAAHLRSRFQDSLPFIKAFRLANSFETARLRRLETLELKIVLEADVAFSLGPNLFDGHLEPGKYLLDGDALLICIDPSEGSEETELRAMTAMSDGLAELFELQSGDDFEKLLLAGSNALRMLQLRRLLDNQTPDEIEKLIAAIETEIAIPEEPYGIDAATLALAIAPSPASAVPPPAASVLTGPGVAPIIQPIRAPTPPLAPPIPPPAFPVMLPKASAVVSTRLESDTTGGHGGGGGWTVAVRVGGIPSAPQRRADVQAPNDAEEWAMLFEESEGRFPLRVSRLQGYAAYGCDCLSFTTQEHRQAFIDDPRQHAGRIVRFIEVKSGTVRLTLNELASARRNRSRYYIYQIAFDAQGRASAYLTIVVDPVRYRAALSRECEVRIDQIPDRDRIKLNAIAN